MKSAPPLSPDIGGTLARMQGRSVTWLAILLPPTLAYLAGVFYLARSAWGPSNVIGLIPDGAEAVLVDLLCGSAPLVVAIACYVRYLRQSARAHRAAFVATFAQDTLVKPRNYPGLIYRVQGADMQIVWNADGAVRDGTRYPVLDADQLIPFRSEHFIETGVP